MKGKLLYIGNLREGGNGRDRISVWENAGWQVEGIDTRPYRVGGNRLVRTMTSRWQIGPQVAKLNAMLQARAARADYDVVMVDKGTVLRRASVQALKANARAGIAIHYTPDAAFYDNRSREFFRAIPDYDLLVTTKPFETEHYRKAGARDLLLIEQGFGPRIDPALADDVPDHLRSEVAFVGHCQPHYAKTLEVSAQAAPLSIWGPGWPEYAEKHAWAQAVVRGPGLYGADYAKALGGAKIAIGLLSKRVPETTTTRTFEIPAMGTMLLAERTGDHQRLFEEGVEAEFFASPEELSQKLAFYAADAKKREAIAQAGMAKCQNAGYSTAAQFARISHWLDAALASGNKGTSK
ncbi:CgeB family protein [Erythrobacter sp. EC-HK427]|uniref:CgeB family protein n=1 Tax=Erythrobacter sp. EC-HK427 TaxID=2038396 RepID=UPI00125ABC08|nr:glycosyltransferase [Erythrobacter sp. EC-HK427]VVT14399.1 Glycosyl transferases group 1 [Erythrobacter sp. EC-HK427]